MRNYFIPSSYLMLQVFKSIAWVIACAIFVVVVSKAWADDSHRLASIPAVSDESSVNLNTVHALLNGPKLGEGRYDYYFWEVYDAALYAPSNRLDWGATFLLKLDYHRSLKGVAIAKRSVKEIRRQPFSEEAHREIKLAAWYAQMRDIFPDVERGDSIIGLYLPGKGAQFWQGQRKLGEVMDADFGRRFFEIWLGPMSSAPELRASLLGGLE